MRIIILLLAIWLLLIVAGPANAEEHPFCIGAAKSSTCTPPDYAVLDETYLLQLAAVARERRPPFRVQPYTSLDLILQWRRTADRLPIIDRLRQFRLLMELERRD